MGILLFEVQGVIALQVKVISLTSLSFANWNRLQQEDLCKICEYCSAIYSDESRTAAFLSFILVTCYFETASLVKSSAKGVTLLGMGICKSDQELLENPVTCIAVSLLLDAIQGYSILAI